MFSSCCRCVNKKALKEQVSENDEDETALTGVEKTSYDDQLPVTADDNRLMSNEDAIDTTLMVIIEENEAKEEDILKEVAAQSHESDDTDNGYVQVIGDKVPSASPSPPPSTETESERKINDMTDEEKQNLLDVAKTSQEDGNNAIFLFFSHLSPSPRPTYFVL